MRRYLHTQILKDLKKKMVIVTGPRQVGKTCLAKQVLKEFQNPQYLNFDDIDERRIIQKRSWRSDAGILVFDEIHKMKGWKRHLKGVYDSRPEGQGILVTGSSRLETFRQAGESLAGRYLHLRLHPLSVKELAGQMKPQDALEGLLRFGGFPEPFLSGSEEEAARWRNQYYTDLIREDVLEFGRIMEIRAMKQLLDLLRSRVGSPLSYFSLAQDLQLSPNTVKRYVTILESLFIVFLLRPFHRRVERGLLREPKVYFYDSGFLKTDEGLRMENAVACSLLKHVHYLHDVRGQEIDLYYLKTRDGKEVDFVIATDDGPVSLIEVKSAADPGRALFHFAGRFPAARAVHLVRHLRREETRDKVDIRIAADWLAGLDA